MSAPTPEWWRTTLREPPGIDYCLWQGWSGRATDFNRAYLRDLPTVKPPLAQVPHGYRVIRLTPEEYEYLRAKPYRDLHSRGMDEPSRPAREVILRPDVIAALAGYPCPKSDIATYWYDRSVEGGCLILDAFFGPVCSSKLVRGKTVVFTSRYFSAKLVHIPGVASPQREENEAPATQSLGYAGKAKALYVAMKLGLGRRWRPIRFEIRRRLRALAERPAMVGAARVLRRVARVLRLPVPAEPVPKSMILYSSSWPPNFPSPSSYWRPGRHARWLRENL
jgi:hypothetical protein